MIPVPRLATGEVGEGDLQSVLDVVGGERNAASEILKPRGVDSGIVNRPRGEPVLVDLRANNSAGSGDWASQE